MQSAIFKISAHRGGWAVEHDGEVTGPYRTREAAFEAAVGPASPHGPTGQLETVSSAVPAIGQPYFPGTQTMMRTS